MSGVPDVPIDDAAVITTMQSLGATSPDRACRRSEIPPAILAKLPELVDRGLIREAASGEYYLYVSSGAQLSPSRSRWSGGGLSMRQRILYGLILWLLIMLMPIIVMQMESRR